MRARVEAAGVAVEPADGGFLVRDPWGTAVAIVSTAATGLRSQAVVATEKPSPYLLQVAKHFRHKLDVRFDERRGRRPVRRGATRDLRAGDDALTITAFAQTPADLERVEQVIGWHLERFGKRDELAVRFEPPSPAHR